MGTTSTSTTTTTTTTATTTTTRTAAPPRTTTYPRPSLKATTPRSATRSTSASTTIFFLQPSPRSLQLHPQEEEEGEQMTESSTVDIDLLYSGQYHELHPGQYHEVNPGQYQEEVFTKPVSSKYPSKGQYRNHEDSYSEEYEVNNVKVDFDHQDNHKTYTVEAKAGDFIIGEVGRIDVNNGQTLEGVRYTALDGEVSQRRISQILERFFGTRSGS